MLAAARGLTDRLLFRLRKVTNRLLFQLRDSEPGSVVLVMRRVFIVPTKPGMAFVALLLIMLIGSINYTLGLGFALTFFTGACAVADMVMTARNLALLRLSPGRAQPVFSGQEAQFELLVHNDTPRDRYAILLGFHHDGEPRHPVDVPAGAAAAVALSAATEGRGWLPAPRVRLVTRFPLGLFRAWSYWQPDLKALVYPAPEAGAPPLPLSGAASEDGHGQVGLDNFAGIRSYQPGDPMRHLAWRQIARHDPALGGQLVTKHFEGGAVAEMMLDFNELPANMDLELRLSRMTRWVLEAEQRALPYAFRIGHHSYPPAVGDAHRAACLRALALYGQEAFG
ncbi:DUF58 domain-containing protein [Pseudoduganella namucuonensis]|uniref:Uncharacterized conserved protein, DUF58 family, contains vWF domain n=1 Tax=Pseudoduganella namucuonensis TaxID=1035707 RepID=A0A1I7I431_9BURK|nr:DUF58 domain-containing protein [Pseudoduganella namucuonensis]SFU67654.1 Uncharacterized conserved protein, DUF58 family, contains vWF domain [Pseudoduganella namucuonensis]